VVNGEVLKQEHHFFFHGREGTLRKPDLERDPDELLCAPRLVVTSKPRGWLARRPKGGLLTQGRVVFVQL
jgi:hypothetical protein